ncbi:MAG: NAD(P)H-hydrate dehydratase, partial [Akkermansia sp.]|nr:NAD(P)H-hydrate dehydratase [Akkermansia sp.]
ATGGPYMANGGQGDVLAGVIGALAAQGLPPQRAAVVGAYVCGLAAERTWAERGHPRSVTATQVIRNLPYYLT